MKPLTIWNPEDPIFWDSQGKKIAWRNLALSVPSLLVSFAVWMAWSVIIVQMQNLKYPFTKVELYALPAIAGLAGATLRIPNSFMVALTGGKNAVVLGTALLLIPALGIAIALRNPHVPYEVLAVLAALSGFGGGNFASSMSNISFFFPKRLQGTALGLNAGIGNLGVSVTQVLIPFVMTFALFGVVSGTPQPLPIDVGSHQTGTLIWIQNSGLVWIPVLIALVVFGAIWMNNLPQHPFGTVISAIGKALWLNLLGLFAAGGGLFLLLKLKWSMWVSLPLVIVVALGLIRYLSPKPVREGIRRQFQIFPNKHTWTMTWLYVMTFGSFIGYSAAFPKLIQDVFGTLPGGDINPRAPNPFAFAWLGPLVGSLSRPLGGWISDKFGGARVTHWITIVMIATAIGVGILVKSARSVSSPESVFMPFLLLFLVLFITTGIGNGSTFRMIPAIFKPDQAGPVLGWTSAIGAYGAFLIPQVFGAQIEARAPELALYGFAFYYFTGLIVNWWFYSRRNAEIPC
ncbi:MAG: antiporter [bacterium]